MMIDGYDSFEPLGHGGFSTVYRAHQELFDRVVAVKVLHADLHDPDAQRRFVRECRATGRLTGHPNIITVFDAGTTRDHRPYLAMEYFPGGSLAQVLADSGPLAVGTAVRVGAAVADALSTAHRGGILHRDIKPANILLRRADDPVLSDFGIASIEAGREAATASVAFTPGYAAPEVLLGDMPTVASDVFAFGATLFALLAGRPPFGARVPNQILAGIRSGAVEPLGRDDVPAGLSALLLRMLDADPSRRPSSAAEVAAELTALVGAGSAEPPDPATSRVPPPEPRLAPVGPGLGAGLGPGPGPGDDAATVTGGPGGGGRSPAVPAAPGTEPTGPSLDPSGTVPDTASHRRRRGLLLWGPATAVAVLAVILLMFLLLRPSTGGPDGSASPTALPTGAGPSGADPSGAGPSGVGSAAAPDGGGPAAPGAGAPSAVPAPDGQPQPEPQQPSPVPQPNEPSRPTTVVTAPPAGGSCSRQAQSITDYRNRAFADRYYCSTYVNSGVYANVGAGQAAEPLDDSGFMYAASRVWVICQIQGRANPVVQGNTNTWWLYTQGDESRSNNYGYTKAWGYLPTTAVSQGGQDEPIPGVPECASML